MDNPWAQLPSFSRELADMVQEGIHQRAGLHPGPYVNRLMVLRPSRDLGRLANEYEADLPGAFRFMTRGLGTRETRSNDLLSLLMFQPDYLSRLIELGEADAEARRDEIEGLLQGTQPRRSVDP